VSPRGTIAAHSLIVSPRGTIAAHGLIMSQCGTIVISTEAALAWLSS
jgi:hypothetical protein